MDSLATRVMNMYNNLSLDEEEISEMLDISVDRVLSIIDAIEGAHDSCEDCSSVETWEDTWAS